MANGGGAAAERTLRPGAEGPGDRWGQMGTQGPGSAALYGPQASADRQAHHTEIRDPAREQVGGT